MLIDIEADSIPLFSETGVKNFYLIITKQLKDKVKVSSNKKYQNLKILVFDKSQDINSLIVDSVLPDSDILFIPFGLTIDADFKINSLAPTQRLIRFNCCKTPINYELLNIFIQRLYSADLNKQKCKSDSFFNLIEYADSIQFIDERFNTSCELKITPELLWTDSNHPLKEGESIAFPNGEIAISHQSFNFENLPPFSLFDGEIILQGYPILHRVLPEKFLPDVEQQRLFENLLVLKNYPILATINDGRIVAIQALDKSAECAVKTLNSLIEFDSRLGVIAEIGFGLDSNVQLLENHNTVLNEPYAGKDVCVHFGLGALQTAVHIDIVCPCTQIFILQDANKYSLHKILQKNKPEKLMGKLPS